MALSKLKQDSMTHKQCNRCGVLQLKEQYSRDKNKRDGLRTICKACSSRSKKKIVIPDGHKKCLDCGNPRPLSLFGMHKKSDGIKTQCNDCEIAYRRSWAQRTEKKCSECQKVKNVADFHGNVTKYDGYASECKLCVINRVTAYGSQMMEMNATVVPSADKRCLTCHVTKNHQAFPKHKRTRGGLSRMCRMCWRQWYDEHPNVKLASSLRCRIRKALIQQGLVKDDDTKDLVSCGIVELRTHLERQFVTGMTWENHGTWHIDHKQPCASFDLSDRDQKRACFHYTNLQPLWAVDNIRKGDQDYETWLQQQTN